jgi:hypothetical protein
LSPLLFNLVVDVLSRKAYDEGLIRGLGEDLVGGGGGHKCAICRRHEPFCR